MGKGFAVVANEVKRLSQESDAEAEKIVPQMRRIGEIFSDLTQSTQALSARVGQHRSPFDTIEAELAHMAKLWEEEKFRMAATEEGMDYSTTPSNKSASPAAR